MKRILQENKMHDSETVVIFLKILHIYTTCTRTKQQVRKKTIHVYVYFSVNEFYCGFTNSCPHSIGNVNL